MPPPLAPSGQQIELAHGTQRATVVEVGAALRTYMIGDEHIVDGFGIDEMSPAGRGQPLVPWPNRLAGGRYDFAGVTNQLPLSEPERGNAIHGLVRFANWSVSERAPAHVVMAHRLHPQPGYPFLLDLRLGYRLDDAGLSVELTVTNRGDRACPFGAGAHPYLRIGEGGIDRLVLRAPAGTYYEGDERGIPTGRRAVAGTPYDFREGRTIGDAHLDTAFTDAGSRPAVVELAEPGSGRRVQLWMGPEYGYYMLFTGDSLPAPRRRQGLAIEPMTCAPNAFRTGDGLWTVDPGTTLRAAWGISPVGF
jgi:aldose 1-epimerase